ncbi:MAG: hypothetical protein WCE50_08675, partial [Candidatus Acidiferrum sp.]
FLTCFFVYTGLLGSLKMRVIGFFMHSSLLGFDYSAIRLQKDAIAFKAPTTVQRPSASSRERMLFAVARGA